MSWTVCTLVLILNVYRAYTQSLTIDEAFTYSEFVASPLRSTLAHFDANNHVLNTFLCKMSTGFFGPSELSLRLPSLVGGLIYLLAVLRLTQQIFQLTWIRLLAVAALVLNPIILDYLSAARGYSLALGFQYVMICLIVQRLLSKNQGPEYFFNCAIGVTAALSAASNLTFVVPNLVYVALLLILTVNSSWKKALLPLFLRTAQIALSGLVPFIAVMYLPLRNATISNFYVGVNSFMRSGTILLLRSFNYPSLHFGAHVAPILDVVTVPAILCGILGCSFYYRSPHWRGILLFQIALLGNVLALFVLHTLFGVPFPYERTGIYFIPLITMTVFLGTLGFERSPRLKWLAAVILLYLCAVVFQYVLELKSNRYEQWTFDAGTKRVLNLLSRLPRPDSRRCRLGISWVYEPSINYYRGLNKMDWLEPVTRAGPRSEKFDYYYLTDEDRAVLEALQLRSVYVDAVSHAVLAARP
ncbi:MAG: hypothetical protein ACR2NN_25850 [Bryobacteraceae bacterium]